MDPRKNTQRYIIITLPKIEDKERILKAARDKETVTYQRVPIRLSADFSKETMQAIRGWKEIFKVMKGKDYPTSKITLSWYTQITGIMLLRLEKLNCLSC